MEPKTLPLFACLIAITLLATPTLATPQETQTLQAEAEGLAVDRTTGDSADLSFELEGDVTVTSSDSGIDRTAQSNGPTVTLNVTLGEDTYTIPVTVTGEGTSLVQTGVSADAWRLSVQGSTFGPGAQFRGDLILIGTDEGYALSGNGILTVIEDAATTNYDLEYTGNASFE